MQIIGTARSRRTALIGGVAGFVMLLAACGPAGSPSQQIDRVFGSISGQAHAIAQCESAMNPAAVSPGGGNHGLFQINSVHRDAFTRVTGQPWSSVYNAYWNTVFAKSLYEQSGWQPWTCKSVL